MIDGEAAVPLASAQDHKAVGDGDTGPNTGGMGAYSPAPVVTQEIEQQVGGETRPCCASLCCAVLSAVLDAVAVNRCSCAQCFD